MGKENYGDEIEFFKNKVITASETGVWISPGNVGALRRAREIILLLDVTACATLVGDTLDVKVQEGLRASSSIIPADRIHFTQVLGNDTPPKQYVARIITSAAVAGTSAPSTALAVNTVVDGPISDQLRFVITVAGTGSFTASLRGYVKS